jgi:hypothetical protein
VGRTATAATGWPTGSRPAPLDSCARGKSRLKSTATPPRRSGGTGQRREHQGPAAGLAALRGGSGATGGAAGWGLVHILAARAVNATPVLCLQLHLWTPVPAETGVTVCADSTHRSTAPNPPSHAQSQNGRTLSCSMILFWPTSATPIRTPAMSRSWTPLGWRTCMVGADGEGGRGPSAAGPLL